MLSFRSLLHPPSLVYNLQPVSPTVTQEAPDPDPGGGGVDVDDVLVGVGEEEEEVDDPGAPLVGAAESSAAFVLNSISRRSFALNTLLCR